jgi:hypothetical protein
LESYFPGNLVPVTSIGRMDAPYFALMGNIWRIYVYTSNGTDIIVFYGYKSKMFSGDVTVIT